MRAAYIIEWLWAIKKQTSNTCNCTDNYLNHTHWRKPDTKEYIGLNLLKILENAKKIPSNRK